RALMASDLIPSAVELLDGTAAFGGGGTGGALGLGPTLAGAAPAPPTPGAVLVVGFDGLGEQVEWQWAELTRLTAQLGGHHPRAAGRIMQRIKAELDPKNVLNPGRFVAGI